MKNEKIYRKNKALLKIADSLFIDTDAKIFLKIGCLFFDISSYEKTPIIVHNTDRIKALEEIIFNFDSVKSEVIGASENLAISPSKIEGENLVVTDSHKVDALKNSQEFSVIFEEKIIKASKKESESVKTTEDLSCGVSLKRSEILSLSEIASIHPTAIKDDFLSVSEYESFDIYKVINERAIISENVTILLVQLNGPINGSQINGAII